MEAPKETEQPPNTLSVIHPAFATDDAGQPLNDPAAENFYASQTPGQPVPAPQTTEEIAPPALSPVDRLIAGKYRTVDEAERGIQELQRTLAERNQENLTLKAVNQALEPLRQEVRALRPEPTPQPSYIRPVLDEQGNAVVPMAQIEEMVARQTAQRVQEGLQQFLGPLAAIGQAESALRQKYPEAAAQEGEFRNWISANPMVQSRITADPEWNLEAAYLRYERDRGVNTRQAAAQTTSTGQAVIDQTRREASAVPSAGGVRRQSETDMRDQKLAALLKHKDETGDGRPYARARLEEAIGGKFLNDMEKTSWGR